MKETDLGAISASKAKWMRSKKTRSQYAAERRVALVLVLAPPRDLDGASQCDGCEAWFHPSALEIDHVDGMGWDNRKLSSWTRVARYWREHESGVRLRALCRSCNASDGARRRWRKR